MGNKKLQGLNDIREEIFALYPNATKISVAFEGDKITVTPNEKYSVPVEHIDEE